MPVPSVWLIGDGDHRDFAEARRWLEKATQLRRFPNIVAAIAAEGSPEAVILAQARPGRITGRQVHQLYRRVPLARLIGLVGSLGEGEVRSGTPLAGVTRIYWHQAALRLPKELGLNAAVTGDNGAKGNKSQWRPHSPSDIEALLQHVVAVRRKRLRSEAVAVHTHSHAAWHSLRAALLQGGYRSVWERGLLSAEHSTIAYRLVDGWQSLPKEFVELPTLPTVLLMNFPRLEDFERARLVGVDIIIAQPLLNADLFDALTAAASRPLLKSDSVRGADEAA